MNAASAVSASFGLEPYRSSLQRSYLRGDVERPQEAVACAGRGGRSGARRGSWRPRSARPATPSIARPTASAPIFSARPKRYDAVVLDLGLPEDRRPDAASPLARRGDCRVPVLVLTARGSWHEKVQGIDGGADDYVAKPFRMEEVLARLRALIRRASGQVRARSCAAARRARSARRPGDARRRARQADEPRVPRALVPDAPSRPRRLAEPSSPSTSTRRTSIATRTPSRSSSRACAASWAARFIETVRGLGYRIEVGADDASDRSRSRLIVGSVLWTIGLLGDHASCSSLAIIADIRTRAAPCITRVDRRRAPVCLLGPASRRCGAACRRSTQLRDAAADVREGRARALDGDYPSGGAAARRRSERAARPPRRRSCGAQSPRPAISRTG